jgi:ABC-type cobalt transport system substrate-binding protein
MDGFGKSSLDNVSTILEEYRKYKPILDDLKEPKMGESDNVYSLLSSLAGILFGSLEIVMVIVGYKNIEGDTQNE